MGKVILTCGMIGAGKTTYANKLAKQHNAVIMTQDKESFVRDVSVFIGSS